MAASWSPRGSAGVPVVVLPLLLLRQRPSPNEGAAEEDTYGSLDLASSYRFLALRFLRDGENVTPRAVVVVFNAAADVP